jgi:hypothetical protein
MDLISEHFGYFLLLLAFIFGCIISICRKIYIHIKSPLRNATIIGYRYTKKPFWTTIYMPTRFWPVIAYDDPQYGANIILKSLSLLIPNNHKIQLRMHKEQFFQFQINIEILSLYLLLLTMNPRFFFGTAQASAPLGNLAFVGISGLLLAYTSIYIRLKKKHLATIQVSHCNIESIKPENYEAYTKQDFTRIENAELVTYQDAMAHYYKENKYMRAYWLQFSLIASFLIWAIYYFL